MGLIGNLAFWQVKAMKGVGGSGERLHSSSSSSSGPNQWEVVAMDYVDLNDLVPQVFCLCYIRLSGCMGSCL